MISVIIPVLNEEQTIAACIDALRAEPGEREIIVADGGSTDRTREIAAGYSGVRVVPSAAGRGVQMNAGAAAATGDALLFLHADTMLEPGWHERVLTALGATPTTGGAFTFAFRESGWRYRSVEAWVALRCRLCSMPYGDQALFVRRDVFMRLGGFREIPLMEDVDFVSRIKKLGAVEVLDLKAFTSPRRWERKGFLRTALSNHVTMLLYQLGVSPATLARRYYR